MWDFRRAYSLAVIMGQSKCLLERLAFMGTGGAEAGMRREALVLLEERRKGDRQSYNLDHMGWDLGG